MRDACIGLLGGLLFESFIITNGKRSSSRGLSLLAKICKRENRTCSAAEAADLVAAERVGFYFSVLSALANRGRSANRQLFFLSLLAQAKGLSRTGLKVFGNMNLPCPSHVRPRAEHFPQHGRPARKVR